MRYGVLIDGEPGAYGIVFPDLPGCTAMGDTVEEALANAVEAYRDWTRIIERDGEVPQPRSLGELHADPEVIEAIAEGSALASVIVVRDMGRAVKTDLSLDAGVVAAIDAAAASIGVTRSAMVELLAKRNLSQLT